MDTYNSPVISVFLDSVLIWNLAWGSSLKRCLLTSLLTLPGPHLTWLPLPWTCVFDFFYVPPLLPVPDTQGGHSLVSWFPRLGAFPLEPQLCPFGPL